MSRHRRLVTALLAAAAMLPGSAFAQSAEPLASADPAGSPAPSQSPGVPIPDGPTLRVVVAPTIAPLVDAYLDGVPLPGLEDFATGSVSMPVPAAAGVHDVDIFADGSDPLLATALATALIDFGESGARTMAVRGDGSVLVLDDAVTAPVLGTSLRLVNLDTDAGAVDAWLGDEPLALGLSPDLPSARLAIPAGTNTLTANAPGDRLSLYASEDILFVDGAASTAFMVPTSERAVWFLAADATTAIGPDASAGPDTSAVPAASLGPDASAVPDPTSSTDPDALEWRTLPVYECELMILFTTDGETSSTRRTGSARVRVPASLRGGLALFHYPVLPPNDPLAGWALGPDGWTCVRHVAGDFDQFASGLTIRSAGTGRAAAARCGAFDCDPAVGARSGRFIAYGSRGSGGLETPAAVDHGVPGTTACAYHRRFRAEGLTECRGVAAREGRRNMPRRTPDGSAWLSFTRARAGDTVVGAIGIDCAGDSCTPHLIECKLRPEDRALCGQALRVMLDPDRVRVPRVDATLACPSASTLIRAGSGSAPPEDYSRARVVRTLRGDHDLVVDGVPVASVGSMGVYPRTCGGGPDRLWYRVRSVDGDRVNGWIARPLVETASP